MKSSEKTLDNGRKKYVDGLSSDLMASEGEVGASMGALDLPHNSDGIFEFRAMPYIKIDDANEVKSVYEDILRELGYQH